MLSDLEKNWELHLSVSGSVTLYFDVSSNILVLINKDLNIAAVFGVQKNFVLLINLSINVGVLINIISGDAVFIESIDANIFGAVHFDIAAAIQSLQSTVASAAADFKLILGKQVSLWLFLKAAAVVGVTAALIGTSATFKKIFAAFKGLFEFALKSSSILNIGVICIIAGVFGVVNLGLSFALMAIISSFISKVIVGAILCGLIIVVAKLAVGFATGDILSFAIDASLTILVKAKAGGVLQISSNGLITVGGKILAFADAAIQLGIATSGSITGSADINFQIGKN